MQFNMLVLLELASESFMHWSACDVYGKLWYDMSLFRK